MKIFVVQGDCPQDVLFATSKLLPQDFLQKNIVFSPLSRQTVEGFLFNAHQSDVFFGTQITTPNAFVCQTLNCKTVSGFQKKLFVRKALKDLQNRLLALGGKITKGLVQGVCDEILRFQQSAITPQMLFAQNVQDELLKEKVQDLAKIYEYYQTLLGENLDEFSVLQKFLLAENLDFSNHNFFIVGFNQILPIQKQIIKKLASCGARVFVGVCQNKNHNNGYIFNNTLIDDLEKDFDVEVISAPATQNENQCTIKNLAFSVNAQKTNLDFLRVFEANDIQTEVQSVAKKIKHLLQKGTAQSGEIAVLCSNLSTYAPVIENQFSAFGLNFYINQPTNLLQTPVATFIHNALVWHFFKKPEAILNILLSDFVGLDKKMQSDVWQHFAFFGDEAMQSFDGLAIEKTILGVLKKFDTVKSQNCDCVEEIISAFALEQKILSVPPQFVVINQNALFKIKNLCLEFCGFEFCGQEFFDVFYEELSNATISAPPVLANTICVGDLARLITPVKYLFVLGVNQGVAPIVNADTMILTDANLANLDLGIAQTVLMQNRSARFDIFANLLSFEEGLYITYSLVDNSGQQLLPSGFVKTFVESADQNILTILSKGNARVVDMSQGEKTRYFARFVGTRENARQTYLKFLQDPNPLFDFLMPTLQQMFGTCTQPQETLLVDAEKLFFADGKTKISQIESYYACPFKHFVAYGLKLSEAKQASIQSFDVGNVLHKVAEMFLRPNNNYCMRQKSEIPQIVNEIFAQIRQDKNFAKVFLPKNRHSLKILQGEALRLCTYLFDTYHKSNFKPKFLEVYFGAKQTFTMRVLGKDFSLVGIVDRVDTYQNNAVVIDYKTGGAVKGNDEELFYGEKLQIFVYAKALSALENLNIQGVFYFPILNKFLEDGESPYMLRGKNVLAQEFLLNFDNTLSFENPKSTILPCEIKTGKDALKNPQLQFKTIHKNHTNQDAFADMMEYAVQMTAQAIKEILQGNIARLPNQSACNFCPYLAICQRAENAPVREKVFDVETGHFALWKEGE